MLQYTDPTRIVTVDETFKKDPVSDTTDEVSEYDVTEGVAEAANEKRHVPGAVDPQACDVTPAMIVLVVDGDPVHGFVTTISLRDVDERTVCSHEPKKKRVPLPTVAESGLKPKPETVTTVPPWGEPIAGETANTVALKKTLLVVAGRLA